MATELIGHRIGDITVILLRYRVRVAVHYSPLSILTSAW